MRIRGLLLLSVLAGSWLAAQETVWYADLGKHCAVHFGTRGPEMLGTAERTVFDGPAAVLARAESRITFGPHAGLGVTDDKSFTLSCDVRTTAGAFATILMCRDGGTVHYSLVMGRQPGRIAFEPWHWSRDSALSRRRLDDGEWHALSAVYDAESRRIALVVDGIVESVVPVTRAFKGSKNPALRLGDNLDAGVKQPFIGSIRNVHMLHGVPGAVRGHLARLNATRLLEPGAAERGLIAWLHRMRRPRKPEAASADQWTAQAQQIRARVQDALGLWPPPYSEKRLQGDPSPLSGNDARATDFAKFRPRLDLAVRHGGSLRRDGYTLERVYWQTFEGFWASGWLYRPDAPGDRVPAILCPHGHWRDGARHPVVQARCIHLAKLGYVVLAVDSIHLYEDRVGLTPLSVMTWNNLRGLELLRSLPEVDASRLGVTGASGGGQQTYYLTALDTDLQAAVPAVMACHFSEILLHTGVHCACNFVAHVMRAADVPQMSAAFAPRPQLFLSVTGDWTKSFPKQGFPPIRAIYERFGAGDRALSLQWSKGHAYDRPMRNAMYGFFERALRGNDEPPGEWEKEGARTEDVSALRSLDLPGVPRETRRIVTEFRHRLAVGPARADGDTPETRRRLARLFLAGEWRAPNDARARRGPDVSWNGERLDGLLVRADTSIEIPALLLRAKARQTRGVAVVVGPGKSSVLQERADWVATLTASGFAVLLADIRYTGELDAGANWRDVYGRIFGRDEGILQVHDLRRVLDALDDVAELAGKPRVVLGFGETGAAALFTGAVDRRVDVVIAPELGPTYRNTARRPAISRILLHGDLPDAALALTSRGTLIAGGCDSDAFASLAPRAGASVRDTPLRLCDLRQSLELIR